MGKGFWLHEACPTIVEQIKQRNTHRCRYISIKSFEEVHQICDFSFITQGKLGITKRCLSEQLGNLPPLCKNIAGG